MSRPFQHQYSVEVYTDWKFLFSLLSGSASFSLCCADEFKKNETACCPQIEHVHVHVDGAKHSEPV